MSAGTIRILAAAWFALQFLLAAAAHFVPMPDPPYQLSHPVTYAPVILEGGLGFALMLMVLRRQPGIGEVTAAFWLGSIVWLAGTWWNQDFVDFCLRAPMGIAAVVVILSSLRAKTRTRERAAGAIAFVSCLAFTLFVHYGILFPVNKQIDIYRKDAVERIVFSSAPLRQSECGANDLHCFLLEKGSIFPEFVPDESRDMISSYLDAAAYGFAPVSWIAVSADANNTRSDYVRFGVASFEGKLFVVMSGRHHFIEMRLSANRFMMTATALFFTSFVLGCFLWGFGGFGGSGPKSRENSE